MAGAEALGEKVRFFQSIRYAAGTWKTQRRVIAKIEHTDQGANPRFIVTNLKGPSQSIYDGTYCARGEMENRIKEHSWGCSPTAPPRTTGGPTSSGCCSPHWPMC